MKSLVVGAMLLHSMNAQLVPAAGADAAPAPLIAPGINTPSEADLALGPPDDIVPLPDLSEFPTGTADVVLDEPTPVAAFGGGSTPGTGISFGPDGWHVLEADLFPAANAIVLPSQPPALATTPAPEVAQPVAVLADPAAAVPLAAAPVPVAADPAAADPVVIADPTPINDGGAVVGTPVPVLAEPVPIADPANTPVPIVDPANTPLPVVDPANTPVPIVIPATTPLLVVPDVSTPIVAPVDTTPIVDPIATPIVDPTPLPVDPSDIVAPIGALPSDPVSSSALVDTDPVSATSSIIVTPTPIPGGSAALPIGSNPYDPNSIYDPNSPYFDPYAQPPGWEGEDNGIYDGEDDDAYQGGKHGGSAAVNNPGYDYDDDEECPAWCLPEDNSYDSYPTSTPDYDYSPYQPTPTPEYPDYEPTAEPYPEYESTPEYTPYPKAYPTPSYAADAYQDEPYPTPTPDYEADPQYYPEPDQSYPQFKKVRSILRAVRRQVFNWPQTAAYPQPDYSEDDDSGDYDGEDGSIPDWLYDISGAPQRPTPTPKPKPTCPKSCYKPKTSTDAYATKPARPTYTYTRKGGYKTSEDPYQTTEEPYYPEPTTEEPYYPESTTEEPYYPEPTTDGYYGEETTDAPYAGYTSSAWYPQGNSSALYWPTGPTNVPDEPTSIPSEPTSIPSEPTSVPSEPTAAPYEPTTLATYYQPQPYPEQTGGGSSDPGSPTGDYTGETLDTICPNTCNPFNPAENFCDITTGCATTGGSKYYCACRAGFRADNYNAKDFSKQFKVAGQPYVYLAVSTSCNTPCSDQTCSEVLERSQCK